MRLFLDCEFTELSEHAKLISLALVAQDGREFYVEVVDAWREEDCSEFVKEIVLPQLWGGEHALPIIEARAALLTFLASFKCGLEIVTGAPDYDWELFCELTHEQGSWPKNVLNHPIDATALSPTNYRQELPHHALLDARIVAKTYTNLK